MLQTRTGKRTAHAALQIAVDMASEGLISKSQALMRLKPDLIDQLLHPTLDPKALCIDGCPKASQRAGTSRRRPDTIVGLRTRSPQPPRLNP